MAKMRKSFATKAFLMGMLILALALIPVEVATSQSNEAQRYFESGNAHRENNNYDRAIADYNNAIRLNPNFSNAYFNRARAYYGKRDWDNAIADYNEAIRLNPSAAAYYNRGLAYSNKKDWDNAIEDFEAALRISPDHSNAKNQLKRAQQAQVAQVAQEAERLEAIRPVNGQVELWNGFTANMTLNQVIARARSLRPSEEHLISMPFDRGFGVYRGDKRDLNRQFQQTERSIAYAFVLPSLKQGGPNNVIFYFLRDKLYAVRLLMAVNGTELLSQTQREYGNYNEVVEDIDEFDFFGTVRRNVYRVYSWIVPGKQVFVVNANVLDEDFSFLYFVSR